MKILVPIDFTEVSANALKYATSYAPNAEFTIIHADTGMLQINEPIPFQMNSSLENASKKRMENLVTETLGPDDQNKFEFILIVDHPVHGVKSEIKVHDYDMIIMGTRDKYDLLDKLFGTFSLGIVKTSHIPVMLVPKHSTFTPYKKVVIASDKHVKNLATTEKIIDWNKDHKAHLKFVHIANSKKDTFAESSKVLFNNLMDSQNLEFSFEISSIEDSSIAKSILAISYNTKADLVIVVPDSQSLVQSFLVKSVSRDLILNSAIPILFLK
jgi:nucleotide-binding universal stress UspA family protein